MQGIDITGAIKYNSIRAGKLWKQEELPWPLSMEIKIPIASYRNFAFAADSQTFVFLVATFQKLNGLLPDGKLGPATLAAMKTMSIPLLAENLAAHDFETEEGDDRALPDEMAISTEPHRRGISNCLIINGKSVMLPDSMLKLGITASNYIDDGEKHFDQHRKRSGVTHFVIHESVTMSAAQTNRVLDKKRDRSAKKGQNGAKGWDYGIHLNLAPDGHISCHADLIKHRLVHANQLNDEAIGLEVVNPYHPAFGGAPFTNIIKGPWWCWKPKGRERLYTTPTPQQMRAIYPLCVFLAEAIPGLPLEFPTRDLSSRQTRIKGWKDGAQPDPGIVAHRDFASHADGRYLLEHCIEQDNKPLHER